MYAIVDIAGKQYKVTKNQKIFVHRIEGDLGTLVDFDQVLLIENDKDVIVGEPVIQGALVSGKILSHTKGDKVKVFKKKRRKGYKVLKGHRQFFTELEIENIQEKGAVKKAQPATKAAPKEAPKPKAKPASKAKTTTSEPKTSAAKAPAKAAAKPAAKKPAAKKPASAKTATKTTSKPSAVKSTASKPKTTAKPKVAAKPAAKKTTGTSGKSAAAKKKATGTEENKA